MRTDERRDYTLEALEGLEERRTRVALYLMEKYPTDVVMLYFNATDQVQHHFWHYHDPSHPFHDSEGAKKYGDAIYRIYKIIDDRMAALLGALPEETSVLVLSDHGGGPVSTREVYLNRFLERLGLLHRERTESSPWSPRTWMEWGIRKADATLRAVLTPTQKTKLAKWIPGARGKLESFLSFGGIDWSRTRAYASEISASSPNIWINLKGRQPHGTVEPGPEYETLLGEVERALLALKDSESGEALIPAVYRKEAIYSGAALQEAPDLTLAWWEGKGFLAKPSFPCGSDAPVTCRTKEMIPGADWSGNHTLWGISILHGGPFKQDQVLKDARIIDLAPTLLALLGIPIPDDMDGKVLEEAFEERFPASRSRTYRRAEAEVSAREQAGYTDDEADKIRERLEGLGYLE